MATKRKKTSTKTRSKRRPARPRSRRRTRAVATKPSAAARAASASDPFRHVVVLMLENRSFDHMLGALQAVVGGLDGVPPARPPRTNPNTAGQPVQQLPVAAPVVEPDPKHETPNVLNQIDDGNRRFIKD